jgi:hypothetical protein
LFKKDTSVAAILADIERLTALVEAHEASKPSAKPRITAPQQSPISPAPKTEQSFADMVVAAIASKPSEAPRKPGRKAKTAMPLQVALPATKHDADKPAKASKPIGKPDRKPRTLVKASKSLPAKSNAPPVTGISLDELIDQAAKQTVTKKPAPIRTAVLENYSSLIRGYKLGVPVLHLGKLLSQVAAIDIKSGTFRNIFLKAAQENGDIKARKRGGRI